MNENREYFRILIPARVSLRILSSEEVEQVQLSQNMRHVPRVVYPNIAEEARWFIESRALLDLMQHIALTLDRLERKVDRLTQIRDAEDSGNRVSPETVEISLSGSGFSGPFKIDAPKGTMVEAQIDLSEFGVPLILALACVRRIHLRDGEQHITAFSFEELLPEDLERIVQLTLRNQGKAIREKRMGDER